MTKRKNVASHIFLHTRETDYSVVLKPHFLHLVMSTVQAMTAHLVFTLALAEEARSHYQSRIGGSRCYDENNAVIHAWKAAWPLAAVGLIGQGLEVAGVMNLFKKQRRQIASMTDLRLTVF